MELLHSYSPRLQPQGQGKCVCAGSLCVSGVERGCVGVSQHEHACDRGREQPILRDNQAEAAAEGGFEVDMTTDPHIFSTLIL